VDVHPNKQFFDQHIEDHKLKCLSHPSFDIGVIVNIRGSGERTEAIIEFATHSTKHLALTWAPIKKIK